MTLQLTLILLVAVLLEMSWSLYRKKKAWYWKESSANMLIFVGNYLLRPATVAWNYFLFSLFEPYRFWTLPDHWLIIVLTFLVAELLYYWYHRWSHESPLLWTMHHTHHSSPWMNLSTSFRLNWLGKFVAPFFFTPIVLLGFSADLLASSLAIILLFQFFIHTEYIGKLGWLEGLINTPSAHRVHHGSNPLYIDKNYGGILMIYDRLFGTYQSEVEPVRYGVTTGFLGHNPLVINFKPLLDYCRGKLVREARNVEKKHGPRSDAVFFDTD